MPREGTLSDRSIKTFDHIVETIKHLDPDELIRQKELAPIAGLSVSTISRYFSEHPWNVAFTTGKYGQVKLTGVVPDLPHDASKIVDHDGTTVTNQPEALAMLLRLSDVDKAAFKRGYDFGNPQPRLVAAVRQAEAVLNGQTGSPENTMTGDDLTEFVNELEKFAISVLALVAQTRSQPRFGKRDWFLDYV